MEVVGDSVDIYQQWSNTGTSSGSRYRFGEVAVGNPADRLPPIREALRSEVKTARNEAGKLSADSQKKFGVLDKEAQALIAASPGAGTLTTAMVQEYQRKAEALARSLRRAVLADRGAIVWSCNPMT